MKHYDDLADVMACRGARLDPARWDDLVDKLANFGIHYLGDGATARCAYPMANSIDVDLERLIRDLARAPEPRLRDALVALLLLDPTRANTARQVLDSLEPDDPTYLSLSARLIAAAGLRREHAPAFANAAPWIDPITVAGLAILDNLQVPKQADGETLLRTAQSLLAGSHPWIDYIDGWEDVARHVLRSPEQPMKESRMRAGA